MGRADGRMGDLTRGLSRAQRAASGTTSLSFVRRAAAPSAAHLDGIGVLPKLANVTVPDLLDVAALKRRLAEATAEIERLKAANSARVMPAASALSRSAHASAASAPRRAPSASAPLRARGKTHDDRAQFTFTLVSRARPREYNRHQTKWRHGVVVGRTEWTAARNDADARATSIAAKKVASERKFWASRREDVRAAERALTEQSGDPSLLPVG